MESVGRRPLRIVSLLPSATEIVCTLGLNDELVGVTHECDYPAFVTSLPKVTETMIPKDASSAEIDALVRERLKTSRALYTLNVPVLEQLAPDVIVTQALCDVCAVSEDEVREAACRLPGQPIVVNLEPQTLSQVFDAICKVGRHTGTEDRARVAVAELRARVDAVQARVDPSRPKPRVAFLEWVDPPFSGGHWNPELVRLAGAIDVVGHEGQDSRTLTWTEVIDAQPEVVFISCCGFSVERTLQDVPLLERVPGWTSLEAVRSGRVFVTDGSAYFSRPGPRLVDSLEILANAIDPDRQPLRQGIPAARHVAPVL